MRTKNTAPFRKIKSRFLGMGLKHKLLLSYIIFFFLPICLFSALTFQSMSKIISRNVIYAVENTFNQTHAYLSEKFGRIKKASDLVMANDDVNNMFILRDIYSDEDSYYSMKKATEFLTSLADGDISRVMLYIDNDLDFRYSFHFRGLDSVVGASWLPLMKDDALRMLWAPSAYLTGATNAGQENQDDLALIRKYSDPSDYAEPIGYYCVYFRAEPIRRILHMGDAVSGSLTFLRNGRGEVVHVSNQEKVAHLLPLYENKAGEHAETSLLKAFDSGSEKILYAERVFGDSDWQLVTIISSEDVLAQVKRTQLQILLMTMAISIFCFSFAWMMARSMTSRIKALEKKMKVAQTSPPKMDPNAPPTDEIGYLGRTYDYLMDRIGSLMEEKYRDGIQVKTLELKTLQEQINPHFLYNTLDTIHWLAQEGSPHKVGQAVTALAEFYRLSLSGGDDEVSVRDELRRISTYVDIQNIRFSGAIHLIIDIDEEIGDCLILKLLLQPFVENAILHGIMRKPSKEGYILVGAFIADERIHISIEDNGVGMTPHSLEAVTAEDTDEQPGYGLKNVRQRIALFYGPDAGIEFTSRPGTGTTAEVVLPVRYGDT